MARPTVGERLRRLTQFGRGGEIQAKESETRKRIRRRAEERRRRREGTSTRPRRRIQGARITLRPAEDIRRAKKRTEEAIEAGGGTGGPVVRRDEPKTRRLRRLAQ